MGRERERDGSSWGREDPLLVQRVADLVLEEWFGDCAQEVEAELLM